MGIAEGLLLRAAKTPMLCVGAEDEPQCMLVCPADCIVPNPDFVESKEELLAKYQSLHG